MKTFPDYTVEELTAEIPVADYIAGYRDADNRLEYFSRHLLFPPIL